MATPICRCRVLYLGSAVPHVTKDGLHGIQDPLRELYPEEGVLGAKGIDSWLSVWSNGLLLENVDEKHKRVTRFFPIDSLHYCAAVRHVIIPGPTNGERLDRFLPLDSPFARVPSANNPPLFACILRRTSGIKVLECHAFVCKKEMAANALVRCCFHSYADNMYARHLESGSIYGTVVNGSAPHQPHSSVSAAAAAASNGGPTAFVNPIQKVEQWRAYVSHSTKEDSDNSQENGELVSIYDGDENHKVWSGGVMTSPAGTSDDQHSIYADYSSTLRSTRSVNGTHRSNRPRQLMAPSSPPPPPPPPSQNNATTLKNNKRMKDKKSAPSSSRNHLNGHGPTTTTTTNGRRFQASEFHPMFPPRMLRGPGPLPPLPPPPQHAGGPFPPPHPHMIAVPANVYRKLPKNMKGGVAAFGHPMHPMHQMHPMPRGGTEEPIYLPSFPPKSCHGPPFHQHQHQHPHPHPQYMMHAHQGHAQPTPTPPPLSSSRPPSTQPSPAPAKQSKYKKIQKGDDNSISNNNNNNNNNKGSDSESKFNTGIYKKKGHLNERAFSYSIRQEHRSRSHSSLSTLNFNGTTSNGGVGTDVDHASTSSPPPPLPPPSSSSPATNGHATTNGKDSRRNSHMNGGLTNGTGSPDSEATTTAAAAASSSSSSSATIKKASTPSASTSAVSNNNMSKNTTAMSNGNGNANGLKNMMNDLSLSDDGDIQEIGSSREAHVVSRKRIVAAANNHR